MKFPVTPLAIHRRLEAERERAEIAWRRAQATRESLTANIAQLQHQMEKGEPGQEPRLFQQLLELHRFDRDVCAVLAEVREIAEARLRAFAARYHVERQMEGQGMPRARLRRKRRGAGYTRSKSPRPNRARIVRFVLTN